MIENKNEEYIEMITIIAHFSLQSIYFCFKILRFLNKIVLYQKLH